MEARDLDAEFRLLRKLTETKDHLNNLETIEKRKSTLLNRYAELKPCKFLEFKFNVILSAYQSSTPECAYFKEMKTYMTRI